MDKQEKLYSTGEAAKIVGRTPRHCKQLALANKALVGKVQRVGPRGDWLWTLCQIQAVKALVSQGVSK